MILKVLVMLIKKLLTVMKTKEGRGASSKDVGNPKEVSWLRPPLITIISRAQGMRFKSHSWHPA